MSKFEFYNPTVAIEPQAGPDAGSAAENLANKLAGVSKEAFQARVPLVRAETERQAEIAGSKLGFKPLQENTPEDVVFNRAAMEAQKSIIQNRIRNASMQFRQDSIQNLNPNSLATYDSRMQNFAQTMKSTINPDLHTYADNMINYYGFANRSHVMGQVRQLNDNIARSNLQLTVNNNLQDASRAAYHGDEPGAVGLRVQAKRSLDAALATGVISPEYHSSALNGIDKAIRFSNYEGQFNRALQTGKGGDAFDNFVKDEQPDITPEEKFALTNRFEGMMRQHKQAIVSKFGNLEQKVRDMEANIVVHGVNSATAGSIEKLKAANREFYSDNPDKATRLNAGLDFAVQRHNLLDSMKFATPMEIVQKMNDVDANLREKQDVTEDDIRNVQTLKNDMSGLLKDRDDDPYSIAIGHPSVINAMNGQRSAELGNISLSSGDKMGSATKANIDDVDHALISVQQQMGVPKSKIRILSKTQLSQFAAAASNANPQDAVTMMQALVAEHPGHSDMVMSNLQTVVKPANFMMLNIASNPDTEKHANFAYQAMENSTKDLESLFDKRDLTGMQDKVRDVFMDDYGQSLLNVNGDPTHIINSGVDYAYKLALVYRRNGIPDPEKQAVHDSVLAHSQVGTYNGYKYVIPKDNYYTPGMVNEAIKAMVGTMDEKKLRVPDYYMPGSDPKFRATSYKDFLKSHAYPVTTNDNSGIRMLDDSRVPVKNKDGSDVGFTFQDLKLGDSEISKLVAQHNKGRKTFQKLYDKGLIGMFTSGT